LFNPNEVKVVTGLVEEAEIDELWSHVVKKREHRWLWHVIDHRRGKALAYVFGRRKDEIFLKCKALLKPFGIRRYDTDYWGARTRHPEANEHQPGKRQPQQIGPETPGVANSDQTPDTQDDLLCQVDSDA
jgi:insertion element IS1 protein InsB